MDRILRRLVTEESGFTLLELLMTTVILSILLLVAVPTYLQSRDNAYKAAAISNAKDLTLVAGLYQEENWPGSPSDPDAAVSTTDSGYSGMTAAELKTFDPDLNSGMYVNNSGTDAAGVTARVPLDATNFCVYAAQGRWFAYQVDASGQLQVTTSPAAVCT